MSESGERGIRVLGGDSGTPDTSWTFPIGTWQNDVADAKERIARLTATQEPGRSLISVPAATLQELSLTVEELTVAEEELRAQNEELQRAQALLAAERERYRQLFEHAPVPYFITDLDGTIRDGNVAAAQLLHCRIDRLKGKPIVVFAQDASRRRLRRLLSQMGKEYSTAAARLNLVRRDGRVMRVEANVSAALDVHGHTTELRWLVVDQTRRVLRDRVLRANTEDLRQLVAQRTAELRHEQHVKDQFVANVSHELRTGLTAVGGYAELLEIGVHGPLTDVQLGDIRRIQSAYHHLIGIVDDLLGYSKLMAGSVSLDVDDIVLGDVLQGIGDLVQPQAAANSISLDVGPIDTGLVVRADAARVRQIVLNLLGNAIKFTPAGGRVWLRVVADESHDAWVHVIDNGPGIPDTEREAIFEPFVRLSTNVQGAGLGLAISRGLARAMQGELTIRAEPGGGSCFVLRLVRSMALASRIERG